MQLKGEEFYTLPFGLDVALGRVTFRGAPKLRLLENVTLGEPPSHQPLYSADNAPPKGYISKTKCWVKFTLLSETAHNSCECKIKMPQNKGFRMSNKEGGKQKDIGYWLYRD